MTVYKKSGAGVGAPSTGNISLDIKYIFINFCQYFFAQHSKFTWNTDIKVSKLVIADKNDNILYTFSTHNVEINNISVISW